LFTAVRCAPAKSLACDGFDAQLRVSPVAKNTIAAGSMNGQNFGL
jgi:hypothetical protein